MDWLLVGTAWVVLSVPAALLIGGAIRVADARAATIVRAVPADDAVRRTAPLPPPPALVRQQAATDPPPAATPREEPETIPGLPVARPRPSPGVPDSRRRRRKRSA
jgi:hypothetical protein